MELGNYYEIQRKFDNRITYNEPDRIRKTFFAFKVELYELANESRFFKFWSQAGASKGHILEEYADGFAFLLSLGIQGDWQLKEVFAYTPSTDWDLLQQFESVDWALEHTKKYTSVYLYEQLFQLYLGLGKMLGFTEEQIGQAYLDKMEVNHQRQEEGY